MNKRIAAITTVLMVLLVSLFLGLSSFGSGAQAGPVIIGNPDGASVRLLVQSNDKVQRIEYFPAGTKTMAGANTPVNSAADCGHNGTLHMAEVRLTGTMAGTAPTLAIKWQNSIDRGVTWTDVGTWTTINATVTPASQQQKVADLAASTAQVYGDCWRAVYTFGGTGTVTANFSVSGLDK